ncbi:methyl-accepting chemotaxis protein [Paenibacillus gansuensis]|uniref:Methyl-accepting chemotaxis protein n=1 Tax=Paenibacillus gansuensis TaxID=306542 RepID=A0ABW5PG78_9BACL
MQGVVGLVASFKARLIWSFILIVGIVAGASYLQIQEVRAIKQQLAGQNRETAKKIQALELKQNLQVLFNISTNLISTQNLDLEQDFRDNTEAFQRSVQQLSGSAATPKQRKLVPKLNTVSQEFIANFDKAVAMLKDESSDPLAVIDEMNAAGERTKAHREYMFQIVDEFYRSFSATASAAVAKSDQLLDSTVGATTTTSVIVLIVCTAVAVLLIASFTRPIGRLQDAVKQVAAGDFTVKLYSSSQDELGILSRDVDHMIGQVNKMMGAAHAIASSLSAASDRFRSFSTTTAAANEEIIRAIDEISRGAGEQASHTEQSAELIVGMQQEIDLITRYTDQMKQMSIAANETTRSGSEAVGSLTRSAQQTDAVLAEVFQSLEALGASSVRIEQIVNTITDISNRTNILSLNAAIEAARAGVHGNGFAVIAEEVRQLSGQTKESSAAVSLIIRSLLEQLGGLQSQMSEARNRFQAQTGKVSETMLAFQSIHASIETLSSQMDRIGHQVAEAKEKNGKLTISVQYVASIAEETAAGVEEVNSASIQQDEAIRSIAGQAEEINSLSARLFAELSKFRIAGNSAEKERKSL